MTSKTLLPRKRSLHEQAFTLVEIVITILILGVIVAIAAPTYSNYQKDLDSQKAKADLQQAATLIEQEQIDNNGLYPKYVPNTVLASASMKVFAYTYSDDRTRFCLQATTPSGKWFVSHATKVANSTSCTQANVGSNSTTPWASFAVPTPTFNGTPTNVWGPTNPAAISTVKWNPIVCPLAQGDAEEWGSSTVATYSVRVSNATSGKTITIPWQEDTTAKITLEGANPGDSISYQLQAKCTVTFKTEYVYTSPLSAGQPDTVATFTVNPTTWASAPEITWESGQAAPSYSAAWIDGVCPAGNLEYRTYVKQEGATSVIQDFAPWETIREAPLNTTFTGGEEATITHQVSCKLANGLRVNSAALDAIALVPLKPTSAPTTIGQNNQYGLTTVIPNNVFWGAVGCAVGTTPQYSLMRILPTEGESSWQTARNLQQSLTAGTQYSFKVKARCSSGNKFSAETVSTATTTFTATNSIPTVPAKVTGLTSDAQGALTIKNDRVLWNEVACDNNSTAEYQLQRVLKNNAAGDTLTSGWTTNEFIALPATWTAAGSTLGFQVQARCGNTTGYSAVSGYSTVYKFTTDILQPATPAGVRNNEYGKVEWNAVTCQPGTTPQYQLNRTFENGDAVSVMSEWMTGLVREVGYLQGYPQAARMTARCVGPNDISDSAPFSANTSWTSILNPPTGTYINKYTNKAEWGAYCSTGSNVEYVYAIRNANGGDIWTNYNWSGVRSYSNGANWGSGSVNVSTRCFTNYMTSWESGAVNRY
jgi:type IV pilus assembly protein PilE